MQDREPTYPGRVTLTPVYGLANTYDMERADRPLQEGTPLNKANLLSDATAAAIKALLASQTEDPATPNDALNILAQAVEDVATVAAGKCSIETSTYTGTGTYGSANPTTLTFPKKPSLVVVFGFNALILISDKNGHTAFTLSAHPTYGVVYRGDELNILWENSTLKYYSDEMYYQANCDNKIYQVVAFYAQN